mmetsp:Transcript_6500/g.9880  ORF Transcript_6500/g.9880 Transcript_6500/m.9880 type:complete len:308 (-) Transcript_6500:74-997(-)
MKRSLDHDDRQNHKMRKVTFDSNVRRGSSLERIKQTTSNEELFLQTLNQFNPVEHSRFEAFKRCSLPSKAISNFVAACLLDSNKMSSRHRINQIHLISGGSGDGSGDGNYAECFDELPPSERAAIVASGGSTTAIHLEELVAPGSASKITAVVSTIAKIHAQRLIQSARAIATNEGYDIEKELLPRHLMEAHRIRSQHGQGFFMQSSSSSSSNACGVPSQRPLDGHAAVALGLPDKNRIKMQAALEAQQICDEMLNELITDEEEEEQQQQAEDIRNEVKEDEHSTDDALKNDGNINESTEDVVMIDS